MNPFDQQLENVFHSFKPILKAYVQHILKDESDLDIEINLMVLEYDKGVQVIAKRGLEVVYTATFNIVAFIKLYQQISNEDCILHFDFLAKVLGILNVNGKAFHDLMQSASCNLTKMLNLGLKDISGMLIGIENNTYNLSLEFANPDLFVAEKMATAKPSIKFYFQLSRNNEEWRFKSLDLERCFNHIRGQAQIF